MRMRILPLDRYSKERQRIALAEFHRPTTGRSGLGLRGVPFAVLLAYTPAFSAALLPAVYPVEKAAVMLYPPV